MQPVKFSAIIVLCLFFWNGIECDTKIGPSRQTSPNFHIHASQLLGMCFPDELNPVAVTVDLLDVIFRIPRNEIFEPSIVIIDENFSSRVIEKYYPRHPSFILPGDSIDLLAPTLREIKSMKIWNIKSLFLIIGTQCQDSENVLKLLWEIEAITSFFICQESTNGTVIYTFNPFFNYAPEPWKQVKINDKPEDQWTLFRQFFINDEKICDSIRYNKLAHLNGYPIKGSFTADDENVLVGKLPNFENWPSYVKDLFETLYSVSNTTPLSYLTGRYESEIAFTTKEFDLCMNPNYLKSFYSVTYFDALKFYNEDGFIILTRKQNTVPIINEIADQYFNVWTASMSGIILGLILVIIYIHHNFQLRESLLDLLALILNMGLMVPMNRISIRLTFVSASLFILIFNPALQGHISAVLSKPARQQVDTLEDLYENKFHVYYEEFIENDIFSKGLWSNSSEKEYLHPIHLFYYKNCTEALLKHPSSACIISTIHLEIPEINNEIHLSKYIYFNKPITFASRNNWPLKDKIDKTALNFIETGHMNYHEKKALFKQMLRKKKLIARIKAAEQFDQIDLFSFTELDYILIPLFFLWIFLVLIIEILYRKFQVWNEKREIKKKIKRLRARWRIARIVKGMAHVTRAVQDKRYRASCVDP